MSSSQINPKAIHHFKALQRQPLSVDALVKGIRAKNHSVLSQAITLLESTQEDHQQKAARLLAACIPHTNKAAMRIGITGIPGVGKSTFIEAFTKVLMQQNKRVAILAIDPTSTVSGGSILGDKTRMESLTASATVFIRPSPSGAMLGGVARQTRETILLCETADFDIILIETVGVGQSETTVRSMVDFFLILQLTGAGDELQGIKRGILELADGIVVTKADGTNVNAAKETVAMFQNVIQGYAVPPSGCVPKVLSCSAKENSGIHQVWTAIQQYFNSTQTNGFFEKQRIAQQHSWLYQTIEATLKRQFYADPKIQTALQEQLKAIEDSRCTPYSAAQYLLGLQS